MVSLRHARAAEGVGPYVSLAEFARMGKTIEIRFFSDMCGEKSPSGARPSRRPNRAKPGAMEREYI